MSIDRANTNLVSIKIARPNHHEGQTLACFPTLMLLRDGAIGYDPSMTLYVVHMLLDKSQTNFLKKDGNSLHHTICIYF